MKAKKAIANIIEKIALKTAKAACGVASMYGVYQPKEPANLKNII
ncbi:MAG: cyclic lactone autoinducer peptide [Oscillospiraceae bacterium]|nr:cyclic lactone autoinducer peptide [Oscillospiraceae bacterium]